MKVIYTARVSTRNRYIAFCFGIAILLLGCSRTERNNRSRFEQIQRELAAGDGWTPYGTWTSMLYRNSENAPDRSFSSTESYTLSLQPGFFSLIDHFSPSTCNGVVFPMTLQGTRVRVLGKPGCASREFQILFESDGTLVSYYFRTNSGRVMPYVRWKR